LPRKAASQLAVVPIDDGRSRLRLAPSSGAPDEVRELFAEIVRSVPDGHFKSPDRHLIEQYAQAIALARQATTELAATGPVVQGRASAWLIVLEKAHRSTVALAARLRLAPQSREDSRSAGRKADGPARSTYEIMRDVEGDDLP
jgi:Phage terminase, small subunit